MPTLEQYKKVQHVRMYVHRHAFCLFVRCVCMLVEGMVHVCTYMCRSDHSVSSSIASHLIFKTGLTDSARLFESSWEPPSSAFPELVLQA